MAIIKDKSRNKYYISYRLTLPNGEVKKINIKNKEWIIDGPRKVGLRYMKYIERSEIEKDKATRLFDYHEKDSIKLSDLASGFYDYLKSQGMDEDTIYSYSLAIRKYFYPIVPETTPCDKAFNQKNIDKFRSNLISKGLKDHTVNIKLLSLKKLITFAKKRKYINRDTADDCIELLDRVKERKKISKNDNFFKHGESDLRAFEKSFEEVDSHWRVPILTLFYGALRLGEWQAIKMEDVDIENCEIAITKQINNSGILKDHTKSGNDRIIKLPRPFMKEIENFIHDNYLNKDDFLFTGARGAHVGRTTLRRIINKHLELANLSHLTPHGLRHSFATRMFDKGYDLKEVQNHLGHTSMNTTMQYYIHHTQKDRNVDDLL